MAQTKTASQTSTSGKTAAASDAAQKTAASATAATTATTPNPIGIPAMDGEAFMALSTKNIQALSRMSDVFLTGVANVHSELSNFVSRRLQEDIDFQHSLSKCTSPGDVLEQYSVFMQDMMREYMEEFSKLGSLAAENSLKGVTELEEETLGTHKTDS